MPNRRDFLKTAAFATLGSGIAVSQVLAGECMPSAIHVNKYGIGGKMKMTFFPYELKLRHVFTVATYSRTTTPDVQVEIEYEGVTGYGEASMPPYLGETVESVMNFLKKVNLEQFSDPFQLEDILSYVDSLSPKDTAAKAAVDIALHDLVGKLLGAPWYKIWGLNKEKTPSTTFTIGIDTPDVVRAKTKECAGLFNILKVKLGRDNDKEMIETIRSVTDLPIAVDANQGWKDRQYALDMIHWLKEKGIVMIEQPMPKEQLDDIAWVTQQSPLLVFADESLQRLGDVAALKGAFTGINIKLMKCGGLYNALKIVSAAEGYGVEGMLGCMLEAKISRSDLVIALGGGVIGDLAGFAASSYLRGVRLVRIPTSLLAQVDSSVGGKVAVDLPEGKNLVGAFYQPSLVLIDPLVLNTLKERFINDGMGEVIKYGCIKDADLFTILESHSSFEDLKEELPAIITRCVDIKRMVVENDQFDTGERMLLNFGHTLAHTIEQHFHYQRESHGEAVAIGMYQITRIAEEKGLTPKGTAERIQKVLKTYGLPFECGLTLGTLTEAIALDKKNLNGNLNVILLHEIGDSYIKATDIQFFAETARLV